MASEKASRSEPRGATRLVGTFSSGTRAIGLVWTTSRSLTVVLAVLTLLAGTLPAAAAYVGKLVVDGVVRAASSSDPADHRRVITWLVVEGLLIVMIAGAQRGITTCQALFKALLGHRINSLILEKALTLELRHFDDPELHNQMLQARQEAATRPLSLVVRTFTLIQNVVSLLSYGGLLLDFSGWAVLLVAAAGLPAFWVEARFSGEAFRFFRSKTPEMRERHYLETVLTREDYAKEIILFRIGRKLLERYHELFLRLYRRDRDLQLRRGLWGFVLGTLGSAALYGSYAWIAIETIAGRLSIGEMTMYLVLFRQGQQAISSSLTAVGGMYEDNLYLSNLYLFLEHVVPPPTGAAGSGPDPSDGVRFEDVTFSYPDAPAPAVRKVSFHLRPGQKIGVVGENGSGKSTLVKLLLRLYEPDTGRILLEGKDVREWDIEMLRRRVAVIFQDYVRYKLTAGENIGAGDVARFEDEAGWAAAARLGLAERFIERLPESYHTRLGKAFRGGQELSGGEWQKIALSRAFMRSGADVFVLDEPTAAMDAESEATIFDHVADASAGKMVILVSHRLSAVRKADTILVLSDGEVVEQGDHDGLMGLGGRYAHLFRLQASAYQQ